MLERLQVGNFKSLKDIDVEFNDFTVLVGQNNSGKSALLESLLYYEQILGSQNSYHNVGSPHFLNYSFDANTVAFRGDGETAESITVIPQFDVSDTENFEEWKDLCESAKGTVSYTPSIQIGGELKSDYWLPHCYAIDEDGSRNVMVEIGERTGSAGGNPTYEVITPLGKDVNVELNNFLKFRRASEPYGRFLNFFRRVGNEMMDDVYYITDNRDISKWGDDPQEHDFVGPNGENTVSMLHALRDEPEIFNRAVNAISDISSDVADVRADLHGSDTRTELADVDTKELFNVVSSGAGLRRLLPIIVQIASAEKGDTVIIEEPEISAYPKTQEGLVEFMLEAVSERGVQIILSTHSHPFIWKVQNMAESDIAHALEFEKSGGETEVTQNPIDRMIDFEEYYGEH